MENIADIQVLEYGFPSLPSLSFPFLFLVLPLLSIASRAWKQWFKWQHAHRVKAKRLWA